MLAAQNRMRRSADFEATVKHGVRVVQADLVIYVRWEKPGRGREAPKVGLIISKSVGSAVERHQVARRLRHIGRALVRNSGPRERIVVRALPSSRGIGSAPLEQQMRAGLGQAYQRAYRQARSHR